MPVVKKLENDQLNLMVCTEFVPLGDEKVSNMAVMEISLPSGYTADSDSFDKIKEIESVKVCGKSSKGFWLSKVISKTKLL